MKVCGRLVCGGSRATALPTVLLRHGSSRPRCSYSSVTHDHVSFIKEVASTQPPQHLSQLLRMLKTRGESIVSPGAKEGLIPLAIPLARNSSGAVTALLRWPTAPSNACNMDMPVIEVRKHGVWLLAKNVDQFIHRILAEEDAKNSEERNEELFQASTDVGLFPDVLERKVKWHFEEGDYVSALVTGEFYTKKEHFPGFAQPYVFNAEVLLKVGRTAEAKDAARGALKSPWWTLGCSYQEVADIAQWEDEQIEYIKEKVTEEGRHVDLKNGKASAQVALDEASFLLDLASIDGTWDDYVGQVAYRYKEAGLQDIARFLLYRD
ncbi:unnamed protein product [Malus baccata var. baccata]